MCGIFACLNPRQQDSSFSRKDVFIHTVTELAHRGPDGENTWNDEVCSLGFRHLVFFDKTRSLQPLQNEDGSLRLVCNGEIYNYRELQRELSTHRFQSDSDCEVILHLYEKYGDECTRYLKGQFAFILWDRKRRRLLAARDRFGICPLYFMQSRQRWFFASEIKALIRYLPTLPEPDLVGIAETICLYGPTPPRTVVRAISQLPPANTLSVDVSSNTIRVFPYWQLVFARQKHSSNGQQKVIAREGLQRLLQKAIKRRLQGRYALGVYASGGLDSSSVAALLVEEQQNTSAFSIRFSDSVYDESHYQSILANSLGLNTHYVRVKDEHILQHLGATVWHAETPLTRTAPIPMYILSRLVREKNYKTVLSGEGADELLVGYPVFQKRQPSVIAKYHRSQLTLSLLLGYTRLRATIEDELIGLTSGKNEETLEIAQRVEVSTKLSRYLLSTQGDRMAMAHGVEVRYPFLDEDFVTFVCSLPEQMLLSHGRGKVLLREAMMEKLPPVLTNRAKKGYLAPDAALLRAFRRHHVLLDDLLSPKNIQTTGMYENARVRDILNVVKQAPGVSMLNESIVTAFTFLVTMQLFHRLFIQNKSDVFGFR